MLNGVSLVNLQALSFVIVLFLCLDTKEPKNQEPNTFNPHANASPHLALASAQAATK
jgi:hypothetical protein